MILFCYFWKKDLLLYLLGVTNSELFLGMGPQNGNILEVLTIFLQNYWIPGININWILQHISLETSKENKVGMALGSNLGQIRSSVKKVKEVALPSGFFYKHLSENLRHIYVYIHICINISIYILISIYKISCCLQIDHIYIYIYILYIYIYIYIIW